MHGRGPRYFPPEGEGEDRLCLYEAADKKPGITGCTCRRYPLKTSVSQTARSRLLF